MSTSPPPKKYIKIDGLMKLNPDYKKWQEAQGGGGGGGVTPVTTVANSAQALPVVSNMDDYQKLQDGTGEAIKLSEATTATMEMMQDPEIAMSAGMQADTMADELGTILSKYEVPMGLMNKLMMLSEFQSLEFIIDDSGSMRAPSDTINPITKQQNTRWGEAHQRLKEMIEVLAYVPFEQIGIEFLNRTDRLVLLRQGKDPKSFLADAYTQIDAQFAKIPQGTTPALEKIQQSFSRGQGASIARYFFGDGVPNGGAQAQEMIVQLLKDRPNPEQNPMTFISCTNDDEQVEWMKDAEEVAPYCSESDDFKDESQEVLTDQGVALPYSKGFHLVCQLVAAMNPDDLDAMDESVPFTKTTLDNLLGYESNEASYKHYFDCFLEAQKKKKIGFLGSNKQADKLKKGMKWKYQDFLHAKLARDIPMVQDMKDKLLKLQTKKGGAFRIF